jgi:hypothetical protein
MSRFHSRLVSQTDDADITPKNVAAAYGAAHAVTDWYVNGQTGSDTTGDGSSSAPFQRVSYLQAQLGDVWRLTIPLTTIHLLDDCASDDACAISLYRAKDSASYDTEPVMLVQGTLKVLVTGQTLGTVTDLNTGAGTDSPVKVVTGYAGIATYANKQAPFYFIRITTVGARFGAMAYIGPVTSGTTVECAAFKLPGGSTVLPILGDTFDIVRCPKMPRANVISAEGGCVLWNVEVPGTAGNTTLEIRGGNGGGDLDPSHGVGGPFDQNISGVLMTQCAIVPTIQLDDGQLVMQGCAFNYAICAGQSLYVKGGWMPATTGLGIDVWSGRLILEDFLIADGVQFYLFAGSVKINGVLARNSAGIDSTFNQLGAVVEMGASSPYEAASVNVPLCGHNNDVDIYQEAGSHPIPYDAGKIPTSTGTTNLKIGKGGTPVTKTWATVDGLANGYLDTARGGGMVKR